MTQSAISVLGSTGRPSTAPAHQGRRPSHKFVTSRLPAVAEDDQRDDTNKNNRKIKVAPPVVEEDEEVNSTYSDDDDSSYDRVGDKSRKTSGHLKRKLEKLAEENEDLKLENETLKDKTINLEGDVEALELQNRTLKFENDTLNKLIEFSKTPGFRESQQSEAELSIESSE